MRLTRDQITRIVSSVRREGGEGAAVYVYGSRLDHRARGGDLDLLVETDDDLKPMQKAGIKLALEADLGIPVDILTVRRDGPRTPFQRIALGHAVLLDERK